MCRIKLDLYLEYNQIVMLMLQVVLVLFFVRCVRKALYEREILSNLFKGKWLFSKLSY